MKDRQTGKIGKFKSNGIYSIRARAEWRQWLREHSARRGIDSCDIIEEAVIEWAKARGLPTPPDRWIK